MKKNPANERIKLRYFNFLKQADGKSDQTIHQVEKAISRFEAVTGQADFRSFGQKQATVFKAELAKQALALATIHSTMNSVKRFFGWLALQPGYKRSIGLSDIEYLNLAEKDIRAVTAPADKAYPTLKMVERVVGRMPSATPIEKRDRALIAFTAITGIRDGALISLKLKHFDANRRLVLQNPVEVRTKFGKRIDTFLFPLNDTFEPIFLDWLDTLRGEVLFGDGDPMFPKTALGQDKNNCFAAIGLSREHWSNASPVREIFKAGFKTAELPQYTPHSFRNMIVSEAYRRKLAPGALKAWSQNLGHEGMLTTLTAYGKIPLEEQGRLIREAAAEAETDKAITRSDLEDILRQRGL